SEEAGRKALALAESLNADDTLLVLISGGASALMVAPADGISLDEKRATTDRLMREGADIHALNTVRKHLSQIKGGWPAARARAATLPRPVAVIASGETTVHVKGKGKGGRNQEFALAAAAAMPRDAALASVGTDGVDGPTDAAGAIAGSTTLNRARAAGLDPQ